MMNKLLKMLDLWRVVDSVRRFSEGLILILHFSEM